MYRVRIISGLWLARIDAMYRVRLQGGGGTDAIHRVPTWMDCRNNLLSNLLHCFLYIVRYCYHRMCYV